MPIPGNHTIITLDEVLQIAAKEAKEKELGRKREPLRVAAEAYVITMINSSSLIGNPVNLSESEAAVAKVQTLAKEALQEFTGTFKYPDWCPKLEAVVVWDHDDGPTATLEVHVEVVGE